MEKIMAFDIIDIGSNSVRLFSGGKKTAIVTRLAENMHLCELDETSMRRTVDAIKQLTLLSKNECRAFATEAVRKATNQDEFIKLVADETGLDVDVISGEEEAEIGFLGATNGINCRAIVIDLGGASCEIAFGEKGKIYFSKSYPFGCVTMKNLYGEALDTIAAHVKIKLDVPPIDGKVIAVGGTATSLAAMAQRLPSYDPSKVHGFTLETKEIKNILHALSSGEEFASLDPKRRPTIMQGATVLYSVLKILGAQSLTVSESDNIEGYMIKHGLM